MVTQSHDWPPILMLVEGACDDSDTCYKTMIDFAVVPLQLLSFQLLG
jgi:hypothetical protein